MNLMQKVKQLGLENDAVSMERSLDDMAVDLLSEIDKLTQPYDMLNVFNFDQYGLESEIQAGLEADLWDSIVQTVRKARDKIQSAQLSWVTKTSKKTKELHKRAINIDTDLKPTIEHIDGERLKGMFAIAAAGARDNRDKMSVTNSKGKRNVVFSENYRIIDVLKDSSTVTASVTYSLIDLMEIMLYTAYSVGYGGRLQWSYYTSNELSYQNKLFGLDRITDKMHEDLYLIAIDPITDSGFTFSIYPPKLDGKIEKVKIKTNYNVRDKLETPKPKEIREYLTGLYNDEGARKYLSSIGKDMDEADPTKTSTKADLELVKNLTSNYLDPTRASYKEAVNARIKYVKDRTEIIELMLEAYNA